MGDGQLADLYPEHTYRNWPNGAESIAFLIFAGLVLTILRVSVLLFDRLCVSRAAGGLEALPSTVLIVLGTGMSCLIVLLCDALYSVGQYIGDDNHSSVSSSLPTICWLLGAAEGSVLVTLSLDAGRMWGHWQRGRLLRHLCLRFDWFLAKQPGVIEFEKRTEGMKNVIRSAALVAAWSVVIFLLL